MTDFLGLTWDHPRGRNALAAAAPRLGGGDRLHWHVQPLEGFESAPIDELARSYDLLVLDHPHLGDALATASLRPLDELVDAEQIRAWEQAAIGPTLASYRMAGQLWALPLDAATQVSARRRDLVPDAPTTWGEAEQLAERGLLALSLAGPHAFLSLCSVAVSFGDNPGSTPGGLFHRPTAQRALALLTHLAARAPEGTELLNPIGLLGRMRDHGDIGYLPLVYGYVTYSAPELAFGTVPTENGRIGSTLGGTGIAVTRRSEPSPALLDHLRWLLREQTQRTFIPAHDGQPGIRAAWTDLDVDTAAHGFYSGTRAVLEAAWVRPRLPGYIPFQSAASAIVRAAISGGRSGASALDELEERFAQLGTHPSREDLP
ncbi:carbohydrate ABC transporter substrate-binding protein [Ruania zhangjianzhongii]|uniref:carbohydrate ABC transporter substrate-binding protein n=1 Tax=Ruania zhangjianzhongii TaxID=2603206 RepID=UPI0011CC25E6|nr:carbohydrate ABC transporter substrate-binding protein [Ruania zhangjianzhongii]